MSEAPEFSLRGVSRRWGQREALAGVDISITPGERLALIGPSGSGKTTLLRLLMASLKGSAGSIKVDGNPISEMSPREIRSHRLRCALVDQGAQIIPRLSVHDNVIAGCVSAWPWWKTLASTMWSIESQHVHSLLSSVGLADRQWDRADTLSGGQKQRVSIARALAGEARLLLADEPTAALDPTTSSEVIDLLVSVTKARKATLVISTHRVSQVLHGVDRLIGLRDGKVFFDCRAQDVGDGDLDALYEGSRERA